MSYPNVDPRDLFGQDLIKVFGPKSQRKHISTLSAKQKNDILEKIPVYVDTDDLGERPGMYSVTNKILYELQKSQALIGIDLDWCDDLRQGLLVRDDSAYIHTALTYKNNRVQRGIFLRHLLQDILFKFNPSEVLTGLARKLGDGTYNLNNGQHRTVTCIILGVRAIPVEFINSDHVSVDVDLYATDNLGTLVASNFDQHRVRVWRNKIRKSEGRVDLEPDDQIHEEVHDIHAQRGSRFVEKGKVNPKPLECTGVGNMVSYYEEYGRDVYGRAVDIVCTVWNKSALSTANCWGLMEFLETQRDQKGLADPMVDFTIQQSIGKRYSDPYKSGMHNDFKNLVKKDPEFSDLDLPEKKVVAAGIYKLCKTHAPQIDWAPIMHNGKDIAETYLGKFKILPAA
jgi:hypothetical protein